MRVIATTVVRESIRGKQRTGWIYDVDWDAKSVTRRLPVPDPQFPQSDDNPRGGVRGGRGVVVTAHGIIVANYDTLITYDDDWNELDRFTHPLFVGTHEIDWDGEHVWMAATGIDAVLRVAPADRRVEVAWDPHTPEFADRYGLRHRPDPVDGSVDYRVREAPVIDQCHINGVARHDGGVVVNCGLVRRAKPLPRRLVDRARAKLGIQTKRRNFGTSMVVRLGSGAPEVLLELVDHDFPTHNGQLIGNGRLAVNDSTHNTLRVFRDSDNHELLSLSVNGTWLRGLEPVGDDHVMVGSAPARLTLVRLEDGGVDGTLQLSEDPNEAVHGLTLAPPAA